MCGPETTPILGGGGGGMIFYGWINISLCYESGYSHVMHQDIPVLFNRISPCYASGYPRVMH